MNPDELVQAPAPSATRQRGAAPRTRQAFPVGALPTVSLLPREVRAAGRDKTIRHALLAGIALAVVLAVGATAVAGASAGAAQARLDAANGEAQSLMAQLSKFRDVQRLQQNIAVGKAAVAVGTSTQIDWQAQLQAIEADMPFGYTVKSVTADSASPVEDYPQGSSPLEKPRAASVQLSVTAPDVTLLPQWLRKLRSIPAYADATATVTTDGAAGYTVQVVVHLSPKALVSAGKAAR